MPKPLLLARSVLLTAIAVTVACSGGPTENAIDREVFIATYVDLRISALETDSVRLGDAERTEILARHGVTEDELVAFTQAHADRLEFMREVWNEIEVRMDREPGDNEAERDG